MALLHHTYILSYPYPMEIYLGHAPWACTLDMYLGHAPRHLGCHVPYLVPPWGMHAAPWTGRVAGTVSYHMTHHTVVFCSVLPCMGLRLTALSCLCVLPQALMGNQPSGCFLLFFLYFFWF